MILLKEYVEPSHVEYVLEEGVGGKQKDLYIKGVFAESEQLNRNGRIYPFAIMEAAIAKYVAEFVEKKRALGELSHPDGRPQVKPEFASHLVTELKMEGNMVMGKAKVLNTPKGQILRGLLEGGVQMGVSTRALGSIKESNGRTIVQNDFQLFAIDAVSDPSAINAFVDAVNESQEWLVTDDGRVLERTKKIIDTKPQLSESAKLKIFTDFMEAISVKK
jgi:hypothetical protein